MSVAIPYLVEKYHFTIKIEFYSGSNFQRQMSAYKFQVFITVGINTLSLPTVLYDATEMNSMLNLSKDVGEPINASIPQTLTGD